WRRELPLGQNSSGHKELSREKAASSGSGRFCVKEGHRREKKQRQQLWALWRGAAAQRRRPEEEGRKNLAAAAPSSEKGGVQRRFGGFRVPMRWWKGFGIDESRIGEFGVEIGRFPRSLEVAGVLAGSWVWSPAARELAGEEGPNCHSQKVQ
ncbi:hypothetical protein LINGRAHAP2_LOCUS37418, partial [Linum grandiflorum]